jgi:hypothetical protein
VSRQVHELLGGVVEHRGTDAYDLSDDIKLLQRLYALNILRLEGQEPDTAFWTVSCSMPCSMQHALQAWCGFVQCAMQGVAASCSQHYVCFHLVSGQQHQAF